jgi:hypothetical protein
MPACRRARFNARRDTHPNSSARTCLAQRATRAMAIVAAAALTAALTVSPSAFAQDDLDLLEQLEAL